jgi:hypothetical protein
LALEITLRKQHDRNYEKVDHFELRELEEIIGEEASGPVSPVIPENASRLQILETPRPIQTMNQGNYNMATL